ncbi:MAG TPA: PAS domain S-box protein, partial [Chloroflexia bacterium]|nr:PAS domain S-box protein [Chloroflexia bacterium]
MRRYRGKLHRPGRGFYGERAAGNEIAPHEQEQFRAVADSASDAIISADASGNVVYWNRAAETVFGYSVEEALGRPLDFIMPERYRDAHHAGMARANSGGPSHVIGRTVELHGLRKGGVEFPLELSLSTWSVDGSVFYTGIIRDITERKQVERELHLMQTIAVAVSTADDLHDALYVGLKTVCDTTGWDYGEAWLPTDNEDGILLVRSPAFYVRDPAVQHFATMSARFSFRPGGGLPGRAWQSHSAEWVPDVTHATWHRIIARASLAREVGLKAAVAIPVLEREEVVAVIVFYMQGAREQDTRLVKLVSAVAAE